MRTRIKHLLAGLTPPILAQLIQRHIPRGIVFAKTYPTWDAARSASIGYDAETILTKVRDSTACVRRGEAAFERDSVTFHDPEYVWPMLACLMWVAARNDGRLDVLDFGGALGSLYFQHRRFLERLPKVAWSVIEQAHFAECGAREFDDGNLRFYDNLDACLAENTPNIILLSGVLQYLPDPTGWLDRLALVGADVLFIDRTAVSSRSSDHLTVQHVPPSIYTASYPMWIFSASTLYQRLAPRWRLVDRRSGSDGAASTRDGLVFQFETWIFERCTD